jgi:hypothetical protein
MISHLLLFSAIYHSRTRMALSDHLVDHHQPLRVQGVVWMDHQWGNMSALLFHHRLRGKAPISADLRYCEAEASPARTMTRLERAVMVQVPQPHPRDEAGNRVAVAIRLRLWGSSLKGCQYVWRWCPPQSHATAWHQVFHANAANERCHSVSHGAQSTD